MSQKIRFLPATLVVLIFLSIAGGASAGPLGRAPEQGLGDLSIEQLMDIKVETVTGASKYEQKVTEAPASVSIVTADEIWKFGDQTLADVMRSVRGMYVADDRNYSYLGTRGFLRPGDYNTRTLVLIDGHRMNDNVYDAIYVARENTIDIGLIDRIEIIRGPGSAIYGGSAFFGVVNIVTRRGRDIGGFESTASAGSFGSYESRLTYGNQFKSGLELLASVSYYSSAGVGSLYYPEFDPRISSNPAAANSGIARSSDGESAAKAFVDASYRDLTLTLFFSARTKHVPTASFGTVFNSGREKTDDEDGYADLKFSRELSAGFELEAHVYYDGMYYHGFYPYAYQPKIVTIQDDIAHGERVGALAQVTGKLSEVQKLVAGIDYQDNFRPDQSYYDETVPRTYYLNDHHTDSVLGIFAEDQVELADSLLLNAGLRYDRYFGGFGGTLNPRVSLIYRPSAATALKVILGRAFRPPNAYERFYNGPAQAPHPLKPETILTSELVLEQYFGEHVRTSVSAYHYAVSDLITEDVTPAGDLFFMNLNSATADGLGFEVEAKAAGGAMARASVSLQRTHDPATGEQLTDSPRCLAKLNAGVPLYSGKLFAAVEVQYNSSVETVADATAPGFTLTNFTLSTARGKSGWAASASLYNAFDTRYGYPADATLAQDVVAQDGRTFRLLLNYRY